MCAFHDVVLDFCSHLLEYYNIFHVSDSTALLDELQLCKYPRQLDVMTFLRDQPLGEVLFKPPASNYSKSIMRVAPILGLEGSA